MTANRKLVNVAIVGGGAAIFVTLFGIVALWLSHAQRWSDQTAFNARLADSVQDAVRDGIGDPLDEAGRILARHPINGKSLGSEDLTRWQRLRASGDPGQVRKQLESRFSDAEMKKLEAALNELAQYCSDHGHLSCAELQATADEGRCAAAQPQPLSTP